MKDSEGEMSVSEDGASYYGFKNWHCCSVCHVFVLSHWQQDVEEADTSAICNRTSSSPRSARPAASSECVLSVLWSLIKVFTSLTSQQLAHQRSAHVSWQICSMPRNAEGEKYNQCKLCRRNLPTRSSATLKPQHAPFYIFALLYKQALTFRDL